MLQPNERLVRVRSHRARQKLAGLLGAMPRGYFCWDRPGEWRAVPADRLDDARKIKGITASKWTDEHRPYIDWDIC